ncbi:MAG TPA: AmmeMemoRadiSam system radical SAM enzyme [Spirochaetota bacterium]|nr:AmmeMemoRadiSam system radical SAM enzyme [Spirochaetota bacterium]HPC41246.1 AmmeMemoRadiSam system radical SAM enzyme [Spirochaetota bacterium]HPL15715.1 AmmeMemoRadiSam system radical SAM enzyme [Spirochaetota bacterium]HQF08142.1 AmmeMemoRadiSam system radical SAM enzyme [Spirochaetota bacterium]HQH96971.1 AmmeMemoRadiSam system radical SAM enzyme [Spirochaetota bacterium]
MNAHEAAYYEKLDGGNVRCRLCPHNCLIKDGKHGICGARKNSGGILVTEIYGRLTSLAMDPIEKKPLYHFHPGSSILSIGTRGCNMKCPYCQNWHISQDQAARTSLYSSSDVVSAAVREGSIGIAYTYSEPIIWFEYVYDTAVMAREKKLANVMVTNGFINREPLEQLLGVIDAMNIDLKTFREETMKKVQKARLPDVLATIRLARERGCHIELTTLVVTGINDDMDEMKDIIDFIVSVDKNIPWHISRYYPNYQYDRHATDVSFMMKVHEEAEKKLSFVYCGNVSSNERGHDTHCPSCGTTVIGRTGYFTRIEHLKNGACAKCGHDLGIIQ